MASITVLEFLLLIISEAIPISKCSDFFSFNLYIRGFHPYKQNWDAVLARRYSCITEEKHNEYVAAVVNDDEVVGHITLRVSKTMSIFLKLTGSHMEVEVKSTEEQATD